MNKIRIKVIAGQSDWDCGKFNLCDYLDFTMHGPIWIPCSTELGKWQEIEITNPNNWTSLVTNATKTNWFTGKESIENQELVFSQGSTLTSTGCRSCGGGVKKVMNLKTFTVSWIPII
jgi:hypothetical protein